MSIFQIIAVFFALFMFYVVRVNYKKNRIGVMELSFWYSLWFLFIVMALFPDLLRGIAQALKFGRVFDLLLVGALMILSILVVSNYFLQKENKKRLEDFVRTNAIRKTQQYGK